MVTTPTPAGRVSGAMVTSLAVPVSGMPRVERVAIDTAADLVATLIVA
jgi:hypothetical protein